MLNESTIERIRELGLTGLLSAIEEQNSKPELYRDLSFEERLGLIIDREFGQRQERKMTRRMKEADFKYPNAAIENIRFKASRGFSKQDILTLAENNWIKQSKNLIITGATGTGKSYLACALGTRACLSNMPVLYYRTPKLFDVIHGARLRNEYSALIKKIKRASLVIIDDFAHTVLSEPEQKDILEVVEERYGVGSIVVTSQLPIEKWHAAMPNPTLADAILDRLIQKAEKLNPKGETQR